MNNLTHKTIAENIGKLAAAHDADELAAAFAGENNDLLHEIRLSANDHWQDTDYAQLYVWRFPDRSVWLHDFVCSGVECEVHGADHDIEDVLREFEDCDGETWEEVLARWGVLIVDDALDSAQGRPLQFHSRPPCVARWN